MSEATNPKRKADYAWLWLLIFFAPLPFVPWWAALLSLGVCGFLAWGFTHYKKTDSH